MNLCWSVWPCELSELCRPDLCISSLLTQSVIVPGPAFSRFNRCSCIGPPPSGCPAPWCLGRLFIFARCKFRLRIQWKRHCQQRTPSSELANFVSNVSKRAQFSFSCCTVYLPSTTIVTRLTADEHVIKSLLKGALCLGLALGPAVGIAVHVECIFKR